jgi:uncharacterized protein (DUF2062 family)
MLSRFFSRCLTEPLLGILSHGVTPERIAASMSLGIVLGVFPALGTTSLLCLAASLLFRLNLPAIQLTNVAAYPLQLLLFIPFMKLGEKLFGVSPGTLSLGQVVALIEANAWNAIQTLWIATMHAIVAWLAVGVPTGLALYFIFAAMLRRLWAQRGAANSSRPRISADRRTALSDAAERTL